MSRYPEALLQVQPTSDLESFFMFALKVLDGNEPLPKSSACDFWVSLWAWVPAKMSLTRLADCVIVGICVY